MNNTYRELFVRLNIEYDNLLLKTPIQYIKYEVQKYFDKIEIAHQHYFINDFEYKALQKHIENKNKFLEKTINMIKEINKNL